MYDLTNLMTIIRDVYAKVKIESESRKFQVFQLKFYFKSIH